jgi:hypothetical protein
MPSSSARRRVEIPLDLYQAINQAAADAGMPTSALITTWLYQTLEARRPDLHVRDPYRCGIAQFERRPRRHGELPDDRSLAEILSPREQDDEPPSALATLPSPNLTTVRLHNQKGGILPASDGPTT